MSYATSVMRSFFGLEPAQREDSGFSFDPYQVASTGATPAPPGAELAPQAMQPAGITPDRSQISTFAGMPQQEQPAPQEAKGFMQRFRETPGAGEALMQMGAGLAGGRDWGEGISAGLSGAADTLSRSKALAEDAMLKRQALAVQMMSSRGAKGTGIGTPYIFTMKDGTKVKGFYEKDQYGNAVPVGPDGSSPLNAADIIDFEKMATDSPKVMGPKQVTVTMPGQGTLRMQQFFDPETKRHFVQHPNINGGKPFFQDEWAAAGAEVTQEPLSMITLQENQRELTAPGKVKLETAMGETEDTIHSLGRFRTFLTGQKDGGERWLNGIKNKLVTFIGEGNTLSEEDLKQEYAKMGSQSLLGRLRTSVVGPGVMTEQDALRVLMALGGDPGSPFWNSKAALGQIDYILDDSRAIYERQQHQYGSYGGNVYEPSQRVRPYLQRQSPAAAPSNSNDPLGILGGGSSNDPLGIL